MKAKGYLAFMATMAMISETNFGKEKEPIDYKLKEDAEPPIPKGCKKYYFTQSGRFETEGNAWSDIDYIFSCVASNPKNAIKKFNKFKTEKP